MKIIKVVFPLIVLNLIALILVTFTLPDIVPIHINAMGVVDNFAYKWYIPILGMIPLGVNILYIAYSYYLKENQESVNKAIEDKIISLIVIFTLAISWTPVFLSLNISQNPVQDIMAIVLITVATLLIILGYYIGDIKRNKFFGIRTPWTLKSDIIWKKTHDLATYSYMIAGFVLMIYSIAGFISENTIYNYIGLAISLFLIAVLPIAYSYYEYRKINDFNNI
ncbi:MAG: SdpI family protein [Methanobacteriaceae archaeon]|jgi:uncharacterized membrane protein|nr:SdpI family protein [Candidatus Methanorudis spinitermitis]